MSRAVRRRLSGPGSASSLAETLEDPTVTTDGERTRFSGQKNHLRRYGRDYLTRLRSAGFEVVNRPYAKELGPEQIQKYRLNPRVSITNQQQARRLTTLGATAQRAGESGE